jgi:hypothetical protein
VTSRILGRLHAARESEQGAALLLALSFVIMVGAISAGLLTFVTTSVGHRPQLDTVRDRQYAADGAVELSIAEVRKLAEPGPALADCTPTGDFYDWTVGGVRIRVDCTNAFNTTVNEGLILEQRNVIFTACEFSASTACSDANGNVIVRAQVNYERTSAGVVTTTYVQSWSVNR